MAESGKDAFANAFIAGTLMGGIVYIVIKVLV